MKIGETTKYVYFGKYVQDEDAPTPIRWRVHAVDGDRVCLFCDIVLFPKRFDKDYAFYEKSALREYLNGEFYREAFSEEERAQIVETKNEKSVDKVFLPTLQEVEAYGRKDRIREVTKYAETQGASMDECDDEDIGVRTERSGWYWTRTTCASHVSDNHRFAYNVASDGRIEYSLADAEDIGVAPMIWVKNKENVIMRKNLKAKAYIYPLPVLIVGTYDENGVPDAMNAAWGTTCDTAQVAICLSAGHKTVKNLLKTKAFTVAIADEQNVVAADYVGVVSANNVPDKLQKTGWRVTKSAFVNAPVIENFPLVLECKLVSYDEETEICIGEVVNVSVDDAILDEKGKIDLAKFRPLCYDCDTHGYYTLGKRVGNAFSDGLRLK